MVRESSKPWVWVHWGLLAGFPLVGLTVLARLPEPVVNSFMLVDFGRKWIQLERGVVVLVCLWIAAGLMQRLLPKGPGSPANIGVGLALTTFVFAAGATFSNFPPLPRIQRHRVIALTPPPIPSEPIARCKHLIGCSCPQGGQTQARDCEGETCEQACRALAQARLDAGF